jgi:hypothetical protein
MKSIWAATVAVVIGGFAVALAAQPPQPTTRSDSAKNITVTGCVQKAGESPTGTSGTAGATRPSSDTKFLLTSVTAGGTGTAGTAGSTARAATASEYRLDGDDAKLTPHVGHKVEIMGSLDDSASSSTPPAAGAATSSGANAPKLKVDSVRMIASSCS